MKVEMTAEAEERAIAILNTCMGRSERLLSEITDTELSIKVSDVSIHTVKEILESQKDIETGERHFQLKSEHVDLASKLLYEAGYISREYTHQQISAR